MGAIYGTDISREGPTGFAFGYRIRPIAGRHEIANTRIRACSAADKTHHQTVETQQMPKTGIGAIGRSPSIGIARPGSDVENRIDERCTIVPKHPFPDARAGSELLNAGLAVALPALMALLSAGCSADAGGTVAGGDTPRAQLARQVDGVRACATLVAASGPLEFSESLMASPSVEALVAAGLIAREPLSGDDGRPRVRIVAGPNGKADVRLATGEDDAASPALCFGTRRLASVRIESDGAGGERMRYSYHIVDAPGWTRDPAIQRAFPFMVRLLAGTQKADAVAFETDGWWRIPGDPRAEAMAGTMADIGNKGFFPCPVPDPDPASPCT